jgi:hypothetical protein
MTDQPTWDLGQLTLADCQSILGQDFVRHNDNGPSVTVRLIQAGAARRDPTAAAGHDRPFTLLFEGPPDPRLTQGRHDLAHPRRSLPGIFLVQVDGDDTRVLYEAVFA